MATTEAITSDLEGCVRVEQQQQEHGLGRADTKYVDSAYVTDNTLAQAVAEGRELIGPAHPAINARGKGFTAEQFDISVAARRALCPAGHASTQCSRLENQQTGQIDYRFEWGSHCDECPRQAQCTKAGNGHRAVTVSEHHDLLQARRREMQTPAFQEQMHRRNAIEGTISEFVRNGGRRTRYRGLARPRWPTISTGRRSTPNAGFAWYSTGWPRTMPSPCNIRIKEICTPMKRMRHWLVRRNPAKTTSGVFSRPPPR